MVGLCVRWFGVVCAGVVLVVGSGVVLGGRDGCWVVWWNSKQKTLPFDMISKVKI